MTNVATSHHRREVLRGAGPFRQFELPIPKALACLPCPFCGGTWFTVLATDRFGNSALDELEAWHFQVLCASCNVEGPATKTSLESAVTDWNRRTRHGLDLDQFVVMRDTTAVCPDCGQHPLLLAAREPNFYMRGQPPFFWLCDCGAIRQAGNPYPIARRRAAPVPAPDFDGYRLCRICGSAHLTRDHRSNKRV